MRFCCLVVLALAAPAAAETDPVITATGTLSIGAIDVGPLDGFSPGGHFDLGVAIKNFRLQAELDAGLWSNEGAPQAMPEAGSYRRIGGALRYYWSNLDIRKNRLRLFVEGGVGRQSIDSSSVQIDRRDVAIGFGMAQTSTVGPVLLGGHFGMRIYVAEAPATTAYLACRGSCDVQPLRRHDVALFFTVGFVVGK